jgi:uncharacterized membrane protein
MRARTLGLGFVFLFFLIGGIGHFVATDFFVAIMPPYLPLHREIVLISGAIELLLACLLWVPRWRPTVGKLLVLLIAAVSLANVHMAMNPELFPRVPEWALYGRLLLQLALVWLVWWCTRPVDDRRHAGSALS